MDLRNPRITLRKAWIHALCNNPWIACSIHRLPCPKGYEQDEEFGRILEGMDLNEVLDASLDESPELLGVVGSLTVNVAA